MGVAPSTETWAGGRAFSPSAGPSRTRRLGWDGRSPVQGTSENASGCHVKFLVLAIGCNEYFIARCQALAAAVERHLRRLGLNHCLPSRDPFDGEERGEPHPKSKHIELVTNYIPIIPILSHCSSLSLPRSTSPRPSLPRYASEGSRTEISPTLMATVTRRHSGNPRRSAVRGRWIRI